MLSDANTAKANLPSLFEDSRWFIQGDTNGKKNKEKGQDNERSFLWFKIGSNSFHEGYFLIE